MARTDEQLPESLQEAVLTVLALDERYGPVLAGQVLPEHFDGQLHDAAAAILAHHRQYGRAPGEGTLTAVLATGPNEERVASARRLAGRLVAQAVSLNGAYVVSRADEFVRRQTLLGAVAEATDRFLAGTEEGLITDVEGILRGALDHRRSELTTGLRLSDVNRGLRFLDRSREGYKLGVGPLDNAGVMLAPKELFLYVAPKNSGKSWFCVHCGRQALMQGAKVVHITLEMEEEKVWGRYHQALHAVGWKDEKQRRAVLTFDELNRLSGFKSEDHKPERAWSSPNTRKWLKGRVKQWGTRFDHLIIKEFPSGTLTMDALRGYLDFLAAAEKFVPHVLIVDYPDLMSLDRRNFRLDMGRLYVDLRGLGQDRNMVVVAPTQGNRSSLSAERVSSSMISEDVSKAFTADTVLTYSQTAAEERLGLARLHVDYARDSERGQTVLIVQSYATGQYVLPDRAALMRQVYWDRLDEMSGKTGDDEDDNDTRRRR